MQQPLKPYIWLKQTGSQYRLYYSIGVPVDYHAIGLGSPTDNSSTGIRTYKFSIESLSTNPAEVVTNFTGLHTQPANITKVQVLVVETTLSGDINKGETLINYEDGDQM